MNTISKLYMSRRQPALGDGNVPSNHTALNERAIQKGRVQSVA